MGPVSAVRSQVQTLGTSPQPSAGTYQGGSAARNGASAEAAATSSIKRPVAAASGMARAELPEPGFAVESAKARAEAAQRAYMMASLAAGLNPLNDRVP